MRCAKCNEPLTNYVEPCPRCQFHGDPESLEELAHITWALGELDTWAQLGATGIAAIRQTYLSRQHALRVALGLRFSAAEAQDAWPQLIQRETLINKLGAWQQAGLIRADAAQAIVAEITGRLNDLRVKLADHPRPIYPRD
ncbi:MAG: hypothetical protein ABI874_01640, partial [Chloroflexota bacterium]